MCAMSANIRAPTLRDLADALEIDDARISRGAANDQFRFVFFGNPLQLVVIDLFRLLRDAVVRDLVTDAGKVHRMTVSEMAAMRKIHAQNLIAVLNRRQVNGHVCLGAAVWLHVGVLSAEYFFRAIDRRLLDHIGPFAAAVVTLLRIAFGVLVCEHRTHCFEHSFTDKIFGSDQLESVRLARNFVVDCVRNQGSTSARDAFLVIVH